MGGKLGSLFGGRRRRAGGEAGEPAAGAALPDRERGLSNSEMIEAMARGEENPGLLGDPGLMGNAATVEALRGGAPDDRGSFTTSG